MVFLFEQSQKSRGVSLQNSPKNLESVSFETIEKYLECFPFKTILEI